jgi:nitrous oxide reductase accessory protein NosL
MKKIKQSVVLITILAVVAVSLFSSCSKSVDEPIPVPRPPKADNRK